MKLRKSDFFDEIWANEETASLVRQNEEIAEIRRLKKEDGTERITNVDWQKWINIILAAPVMGEIFNLDNIIYGDENSVTIVLPRKEYEALLQTLAAGLLEI